MKLTTPPSARRATRVIAISEAAKADLVADARPRRRQRIDVTPLGVRLDAPVAPRRRGGAAARASSSATRPSSCASRRSASTRTSRAWSARSPALADRRVMLVLPGSPTPHEAELRALAAELGVADRVRFPGWITNAELEGLYALAPRVRPALVRGGLRAADPRGDGARRAGRLLERLVAARGGRRRRGAVRPALGRVDRRRAVERLLGDADAARRARRARPRAAREFTWERTARATLAGYRRGDRPDAARGRDGLRSVALNALFLDPGVSGGTETYLRELVPALAAERPGLEI